MKQHSIDTLESQIINYIYGIQGKNLGDTKVEISGNILFIFLKGIFSPMKKAWINNSGGEIVGCGLEKIVGSKIIDSYESFTFSNEAAACSVYIFEKRIKR